MIALPAGYRLAAYETIGSTNDEALRLAEANPGVGSPRVGELIDVPGLRRVAVAGFPCGWLYVERDEAIDVVRLLADPQDLGAALGLRDG